MTMVAGLIRRDGFGVLAYSTRPDMVSLDGSSEWLPDFEEAHVADYLRHVGDGWAVTCGDRTVGSAALDTLEEGGEADIIALARAACLAYVGTRAEHDPTSKVAILAPGATGPELVVTREGGKFSHATADCGFAIGSIGVDQSWTSERWNAASPDLFAATLPGALRIIGDFYVSAAARTPHVCDRVAIGVLTRDAPSRLDIDATELAHLGDAEILARLMPATLPRRTHA